jgi:hypothetical protein
MPSRQNKLRMPAIAAAIVSLLLGSCSKPPPEPAAGAAATNAVSATPVAVSATNVVSENKLHGRWLRPDGGYVIEVRSVEPGGRLEVYYFNPRQINVSKAEWRRENGLNVFVELRDQNYPGATYKLRYVPETDQLAGEYYQPAYQQTFDVYFIREIR